MKYKFRKFLRFILIYGIKRTLIKSVGRTNKILFKYRLRFKIPDSALIGAGQFGTTTISYFLYAKFKNRFKYVYDIDKSRSTKYVNIYPNTNQVEEIETILNDKDIRYVFIASNHFSHTNYAIEFLTKGIDVYCEKPISVTFDQFDTLLDAIKKSNAAFYAGYNRPFSSAIETLKKSISGSKNIDGKFSLNCFVSAHDIPKDHWYRKEEEGTRICGNAGHWIDLMIHLFNIRGSIPKSYEVQIAYSDTKESDDNIVICITTPLGDLTSITITARSEPFEGINETINLQYDKVIVKIDDFRSVIIWDDDKLYRKKYRIKDVGHKRSVMQPFVSEKRDLNEVIASTELMLHIADMVKVAEKNKKIELFRSL